MAKKSKKSLWAEAANIRLHPTINPKLNLPLFILAFVVYTQVFPAWNLYSIDRFLLFWVALGLTYVGIWEVIYWLRRATKRF